MEQLPENVRGILAISSVNDLNILALQADRIIEVVKPQVNATQLAVVAHDPNNNNKTKTGTVEEEIEQLKKQIEQLSVAKGTRRSNIRNRFQRGRWRSQSRSRSKDRRLSKKEDTYTYVCYYHSRFGNSARHCLLPCGWKKPEEKQEN